VVIRPFGEKTLLPEIDPLNEAWFTSGQITVQECERCESVQHPPDEMCRSCQSTDLGWRVCSGEGRIESVAVVHHPVHPALADCVPYAVVVVSVKDAPGVNAVGNVVNRPAGEVEIGQSVRAVFEEVADPDGGDSLWIPQWEVI
jgi:hypothetical protein